MRNRPVIDRLEPSLRTVGTRWMGFRRVSRDFRVSQSFVLVHLQLRCSEIQLDWITQNFLRPRGWSRVHGILVVEIERGEAAGATPPRVGSFEMLGLQPEGVTTTIFGFKPKRSGRKVNLNFVGRIRMTRFGL